MRATSQLNNQTLPLNFGDNSNKLLLDGDNNQNDVSLTTVQVPMMQSSSIRDANASPIKSKVIRVRDDDTYSQGNRSTTTQGGGLANKIG